MELSGELDNLMDSLPDGVVISTLDGCITFVNQQLGELTGHTPADLVGQPFETLLPERLRDDYLRTRKRRAASASSNPPFGSFELALLRADGTEVWVDVASSVVGTPEAGYVLRSMRDMTHRFESEARLRAAVEVNEALLAGRDPDEILRLVCRRARELVLADLATIAAPAGDGSNLTIRVAEGEHAPSVEGIVFPPEQSVSGTVVRTGEAEIIVDASTDDRFYQPVVALGKIGPAVIVPLSARGHPFGTILVANSCGGRQFTERELRLVETFAAQAAVTLEYARAQQELQRLMVFEDRERIARDLHDTVIQRLFATGMSLQSAVDLSPEQTSDRIRHAIDELDTTIREIRSTIFALETARRSGSGIRDEVLNLVSEAARGLGFQPHVRFDGAIDSAVSEETAEHLLSTLREALSNVARHARATKAEVNITLSDGIVHLQVVDDGVGIPRKPSRTGLGLRNMAERAESLGGRMELSTPPRGGSVLDWQVPAA